MMTHRQALTLQSHCDLPPSDVRPEAQRLLGPLGPVFNITSIIKSLSLV